MVQWHCVLAGDPEVMSAHVFDSRQRHTFSSALARALPQAESRLGGPLTEVLLEVRRWGYRVLLEVSTEDTIERHEVYWSLKP